MVLMMGGPYVHLCVAEHVAPVGRVLNTELTLHPQYCLARRCDDFAALRQPIYGLTTCIHNISFFLAATAPPRQTLKRA